MSRALILILAVVLLGLAASPVRAQAPDRDDFMLRVNADVTIAATESVGTLLVIDGDALIEGRVRKDLVVISGDAIIAGRVEGNVTVIAGDIRLRDGSSVASATSVRGDVIREPGANVSGEINERDSFGFFRWAGAAFSVLFWLALTIALLAAALIFAAVGGRQLQAAAAALTGEAANTIVAAVFLWVGVPILAVIMMFTLVGIPLGLGLLLLLLPGLWFLGYITTGTRLGLAIVGTRPEPAHPYGAAALGVFILQMVALVPVVGQLIALAAGLWGAGALALVGYRAASGKSAQPAAKADAT